MTRILILFLALSLSNVRYNRLRLALVCRDAITVRQELFKRMIQAGIDSIEEEGGIPHEEFMTVLERKINERSEPAIWEKIDESY